MQIGRRVANFSMCSVIVLDAGPLGMVAHPKPQHDVEEWIARIAKSQGLFVIPEIADYEVRRELIRSGSIKGLRRLDRLDSTSVYLPMNTGAIRLAAQFWAEARQ